MIQFGDSREFALRLHPLIDPPRESDASAAATWVGLEITVKGKSLTSHTHTTTQQFHTAVNWPAVYFARWLVRSWAELFESSRWPIMSSATNARDMCDELDEHLCQLLDEDSDDEALDEFIGIRDHFVSTHSMLAGSAGSMLPDLYFSREGDRVILAWASHSGDEFFFRHEKGETDISYKAFVDVVINFVDWLCDTLPDGDEKKEFENWLRDLATRQAAERVLKGYAGLSGKCVIDLEPSGDLSRLFDLQSPWFDDGVYANPQDSPVAVAFRCCSPELTVAELKLIRTLVSSSSESKVSFSKLEGFTTSVARSSPSSYRDYEQGYELANRVRTELGNTDGYLDIERLIDDFGIEIDDNHGFSDSELDGGAVFTEKRGRPLIFVNKNSLRADTPWGRRMVLAHELCHLLFDRNQFAQLAIVSGPWAPARIERRANAFAAELLLPLTAIRAELGHRHPVVTDERLKKLMDNYKVGTMTCTWHVKNRLRLQ